MDSRKRKSSRPALERNVRAKPSKFVDEEDSDEYDNDMSKAGRRSKVLEAYSEGESDGEDDEDDEPVRGGHDEDDEDEDEDDEDSEEDDGEEEVGREATPEPEAPSPTENLTFGQILKKREKKSKGKQNGAASASGSKAVDKGEAPTSWKDDRSGKPAKGFKPARAHKHAPTEMSSRFAVKRGRDWTSGDATIAGVTVKSAEDRSRDPRFFLASMAAPPTRADELRAQRNYAFLDEYRDSEMAQMRETIAQNDRIAKTERKKRGANAVNRARAEAAEKEAAALRRTLTSMEARKHDREAKEKAQAVLDEHKKRERGLVKDGKTPYFLKKSEQKKRLLVDKFAGMTEQQVDKAIERRRKKAQTRERREMPMLRH
ncbi:rRNA biogenesis protein rrp36 [Sporothrix stenoceras]|uniref:rRNA biogenesis protein RRP36 n=1 Tax=Sporothrix stenoceras TaxID=5173 RepID=A0ABR3ZIL4_9PEZI